MTIIHNTIFFIYMNCRDWRPRQSVRNKLNQLINVEADNGMTASYEYDAMGRRNLKNVNGTETYMYSDGANVISEVISGTEETGSTINHYYRGKNLVVSNTAGTLNRYSYDPHGSVTAINGVEVYSYDAFGNQIADNPAYTNPFRYCGEYFDEETGLIYLRARYYDPSIGRFISEDPVKDGVNWYVYCGSDPVNFVDPSGYLNTGYDKDGNWHDWDAEEFGSASLIYDSLVTLTEMWNIMSNNRRDIEELADKVREVGRQFGISNKLKIAAAFAPDTANATDVVLIAGDMDKAYMASKDKETAEEYASEIYNNSADGSQHNALKHTMWSALVTKRYGEEYARLMTNAHEFGAEENYNQSEEQRNLMNMDLFNNAKGRELGLNFKKNGLFSNYNDALADAIIVMINNQEIWVTNWQE